MPATTIINGPTIAAGQSLSSAIDCSLGIAVAIAVPATWQAAMLTFQLSPDNVFFGDMYDDRAKEVAINVEPGTVVRTGLSMRLGSGWLKFRSGSRYTPVIQPVQQDFKIFLEAS